MRSTRFLWFLAVPLVFSIPCAFVTDLLSGGGGPPDFSARATSPDSVLLTWSPVEDATAYHLEVRQNGREYVDVLDLPATTTQFEDFMAEPEIELAYRIRAVLGGGRSGWSTTAVQTGERQANPLSVQPTYDSSRSVTQLVGPAGAGGASYPLSR